LDARRQLKELCGDQTDSTDVVIDVTGYCAERVVIDGEVVADGGTGAKVDGERIRARAWEAAEQFVERL
jgi:hypothetical protein